MLEYAGLHILKNPFHIDNCYDYFVPPDLRESLCEGDFVAVPFGNSNKREIALVISLKDFPDSDAIKCKPILSICDKRLSLSREMLKLCLFMKEQTLCSIGDAIKVMMPSAALTDPHEIIKISEKYASAKIPKGIVSEGALFIAEKIQKKGKTTMYELEAKYSKSADYLFNELFNNGIYDSCNGTGKILNLNIDCFCLLFCCVACVSLEVVDSLVVSCSDFFVT